MQNPASLPISEALVAGLAEWKDRFDETLNQEYPPESGFGSPDTEDEFYADGLRLAAALAIELLDSHLVEYHDDRSPVGDRELHLLRDGAVVVRDGQLILPRIGWISPLSRTAGKGCWLSLNAKWPPATP